MPDPTVALDTDLTRLETGLDTAIRWAVRLEGETVRLADEIADLEAERDAFADALSGATARVYDERRKIIPLRIERDELADTVRHYRRALADAERTVIDRDEQIARLEADLSDAVDLIGAYAADRYRAAADA